MREAGAASGAGCWRRQRQLVGTAAAAAGRAPRLLKPVSKLAFEMVSSNGLHMETAACSGVLAPSSPRYLREHSRGERVSALHSQHGSAGLVADVEGVMLSGVLVTYVQLMACHGPHAPHACRPPHDDMVGGAHSVLRVCWLQGALRCMLHHQHASAQGSGSSMSLGSSRQGIPPCSQPAAHRVMMLAPRDQPAASSTLSGYLRATWDTTALQAAGVGSGSSACVSKQGANANAASVLGCVC